MIDSKAESIRKFDLLLNFMWRRAEYLLSQKQQGMEVVQVMDPCAGDGSLISRANPSYTLLAYESDYAAWNAVEAVVNEIDLKNHAINAPFEFHFTKPFLPEYDLIISVPCINRTIDRSLEKDPAYLKIKNYAYYVMIRALDIMEEGGFGVFAIPKKMMNKEEYEYEIEMIAERGVLLPSDGHEDYAIILLQKTKA